MSESRARFPCLSSSPVRSPHEAGYEPLSRVIGMNIARNEERGLLAVESVIQIHVGGMKVLGCSLDLRVEALGENLDGLLSDGEQARTDERRQIGNVVAKCHDP